MVIKYSIVGFDFDYDAQKVWKLNLPTEEMDIDELIWLLDIPFWWQNGGKYNLTPNTVLNNPDKYERKYKKILNADLDYPIHIIYWKNSWMILDGLHRLSKQKLNEAKKIKVIKVPHEAIPLIIVS